MTDITNPVPPLQMLRVLEFAGGFSNAGRYFAELGATVDRVEHVSCEETPSEPSNPDIAERLFLDRRGKHLHNLQLDSVAGRETFFELARQADILIEDGGNTFITDAGTVSRMRTENPALVILSVSGFGRTGPGRAWKASDAVLHALSGELSRSGLPGHEPLVPPGEIAAKCAAAQAAFVALLAHYNARLTGCGDQLDFSMLEGAVQTLDPGFGINGSAAAGTRADQLPRGRPDAAHLYPIFRVADGLVRICVLSPRQWRGMFEWMGSPQEFADSRYAILSVRQDSPTLIPAIASFFAGQTCAALEEAGQKYGVPIATIVDSDSATGTPHVKARAIFEEIEISTSATVKLPRSLFEIDGTRVRIDPLAFGTSQRKTAKACSRAAAGSINPGRTRPLAGLKVLDLGVIIIGAETGRLFADAGADVIKIENASFPDGSRQSRDGSLISPSFAAGHRNKRSLILNLRNEEGRAVFLRLVKEADVLLSNFKPGTLNSLGLDAATLFMTNPRLISVDSSAFGSTGPWSGRLGYGPLVRAASGATAAWRYPDGEDSFCDAITVYPDHVGARLGALAALALIIRRFTTGLGGRASLAQSEIIMDHFASTTSRSSKGGRKISLLSSAVFQCRGEDDWCAISVEDQTQLAALSTLLNHRATSGSFAIEDHLCQFEQALKAWALERSADEAMELLQRAGVPAGAMLRVQDMPSNRCFKQRGFFTPASHPAVPEQFLMEARPVRCERMEDPDNRPAPLMGEHTIEVLREWLRLPDAMIETLLQKGVVETVASIPDTERAGVQFHAESI